MKGLSAVRHLFVVTCCCLCGPVLCSGVPTLRKMEHVCKSSIDIRNAVSDFYKLENCTIIEGHLHILLMDYTRTEDFEQLSFPNLREIADYLLLYRVYGMQSLSHMFPNLITIRGQTLFFNYALVVFEMPDLEDLGLWNLRQIVRGAVRVERNPRLCYVDTIDWSMVLGNRKVDNFIVQNRDANECVNICPKRDPPGPHCPTMVVTLDSVEKFSQPLCWNADKCQSVVSESCRSLHCLSSSSVDVAANSAAAATDAHGSCYKDNSTHIEHCCHSECLAGCSGGSAADCFACAHVFHDGRCLARCPRGLYQYRGWRCIHESECRELNHEPEGRPRQFWKLRDDGLCDLECPAGQMENHTDKHRCVKCVGECPKVCKSAIVDSIAVAQELRGCTVIDGSLDIQIRGGNHIGTELEENLGAIEEVRGYVKIVRSYALLSLRFLKSLTIIGGERLYDSVYALFLLDNENLLDIWDLETHPNLTIKKGIIFFHLNRKLCLYKIYDFKTDVGMDGRVDDSDISPTNNGDQVACEITMVNIKVIAVTPGFAVISWDKFNTSDERQLLSWIVNYREANDGEVTIYDARDACTTSGVWTVRDHPLDFGKATSQTAFILHELQPYTRYAVYVQTYTILSAKTGARSPILYFTTKPKMPSPAHDVVVDPKHLGELHISWYPPLKPNGQVTHYYVYWHPQPFHAEKYHQRNYCDDKLRPLPKSKVAVIVDNMNNQSANNASSSGQCCACPKTKEQQRIEDEERQFQIEFENFLQDTLYRKGRSRQMVRKRRTISHLRRATSRRRRQRETGPTEDILQLAKNSQMYSPLLNNYTLPGNSSAAGRGNGSSSMHHHDEGAVVYGKTELVVGNLRHFQEYSIEVIACQDFSEGAKLCSNRAIMTSRTLPDSKADTIDPHNITFDTVSKSSDDSGGQVRIRWSDPPYPNGLIVLYDIELFRPDVANYKPDIRCIPYQQYLEEGGYVVSRLASGNWSFRIRVTSLAGNGSWTDRQYFYISQSGFAAAIPLIMGLLGAAVVICAIVFVLVAMWCIKKRQERMMTEQGLYVLSPNPVYDVVGEVYVLDEWEVPREKIKILRAIGAGSFGMVYEGTAENLLDGYPLIRVAVKTTNEKASIHERIAFLNEASVMKAFKCHHVVMLYGVVSQGQPTLVIMELMAQGDLKNYLRQHRPTEEDNYGCEPLDLAEIIQMAGEIADGMAYLSSRKFVHRDLAARNCMVSEDRTVKVGDFGMARDIYQTDYYRKGTKGLLPVRWMAPESLKDGIFDSQSDVWSYGVVLWEMATLAAQPYQGLSNEEVLKYVGNGGLMVAPEGCPMRLYEIMRRCWLYNPKHRPSFFDILQDFEPDMSDRFREMSFYFNQDVGETASVSDENECDVADNLETDHLTKASDAVAASCSSRSSPGTPKCRDRSAAHRAADLRDCLPGNSEQDELAESEKPLSVSTSRGTDRLLATSEGNDVLSVAGCGLPLHDRWNGGDASSDASSTIDIDADTVRQKGMLRNGHIPYNFVTTAPC